MIHSCVFSLYEKLYKLRLLLNKGLYVLYCVFLVIDKQHLIIFNNLVKRYKYMFIYFL